MSLDCLLAFVHVQVGGRDGWIISVFYISRIDCAFLDNTSNGEDRKKVRENTNTFRYII